MSEWRETTLGEILNFRRGHDLPKHKRKNGNIPIISSSGITGYHNDYQDVGPGIVTGRYGTIGQVFFVEGPYWPLNTTLYVDDFKDNDPQFLSYFLRSIDFEKYNDKSTIPGINRNHLHLEEVSIPQVEEQQAIASILSSLDDKINLLQRQNRTLEQLAETLFRQWFVEEVDEDWEFTSLEHFVTCFNGVSYKSADLNPSDKAMITLKSFARDGGFRLDGFKEYTGKYKEQHIVHEGDLVVAHTDITQDASLIGNPIMVIGRREYKTLLISMDLVKVVSNHDWFSQEFLYYQMKAREFKQHCLGYSNGSTVLHLSKDAVPSYEFFLPPKELIESFTNQVKPLIAKSNMNIKHIRNLEEIRDTLLPKLMSGEVKVAN